MTDFRWDDLDQKLLSIRTQDLAEEMGGFAQREISEVQQKAVASNNSAYYVPAFCEAQLRVLDDWSKRLYEIYCDVWKKQGHSITAEFVRAVRDHAIETLFAARRSSAIGDLALRAMGINEPLNPAVVSEWYRQCDRLKTKWFRKLEGDALELEHCSKSASRDEAVRAPLNQSEQPLPSAPTKKPKNSAATNWQSIEISFLSDHRVQIRVDGRNMESLNFAEFGFVDGRTQNSNKAWEPLLVLAKERGIIRDAKTAGDEWPKVEKRIQEIRKVLREYFGLDDDPIPFVEGTGYQSIFKIICARSFDSRSNFRLDVDLSVDSLGTSFFGYLRGLFDEKSFCHRVFAHSSK